MLEYMFIKIFNMSIPLFRLLVPFSFESARSLILINPMQIAVSVATAIWFIGLIVFIIYGIYSYRKVKKYLSNAITEDGKIYSSEHIKTAFVFGIIRPKIFLPESVSNSEIDYILCHEQTHIKRLDHIFRFISYMVLGIHWFNPIVWVAFYLSGKDMEMACDESVIEKPKFYIAAKRSI